MNAMSAEVEPSVPGFLSIRQIARGGYGYVQLYRRCGPDSIQPEFVAGKSIHRRDFIRSGTENEAKGYERAFSGLQNFRSLSRDSPHLLRIFSVHQCPEDEHFSYLMELADDLTTGSSVTPENYRPHTLKNELTRDGARRRVPGRRCIEIVIQLCHGLQILHDSGFTHRDVRPSNIIFVNGVPKLADIDLLTEDTEDVVSYIPVKYAAPEGSHSAQADIYSLGLTLYEMSCGRKVDDFPTLPTDLRHWPDQNTFLGINNVIGRACARDPRDRYLTAGELRRDLEVISTTTEFND